MFADFVETLTGVTELNTNQICVAKFHENLFKFSRVLDRITCSHITYLTFWVCKECSVFWFLEKRRLCWQNWIKQMYFAKFHENIQVFSSPGQANLQPHYLHHILGVQRVFCFLIFREISTGMTGKN